MKANDYRVLEMALKNGMKRGRDRAHVNNSNPTEQIVCDDILSCQIYEIYQWFDFDEPEESEP